MTKKRSAKKVAAKRSAGGTAGGDVALEKKAQLSPAQEAHHITFVLQGFLKRARLHFLIIGSKLAEVRDRRMHISLGYSSMEAYAEARLKLSRASLYRYLVIHDWVVNKHQSWLKPGAKGFIPDFWDCMDLMWIENELDRANLSPTTRTTLEKLRQKALNGELRKGEVDPFRRRAKPDANSLVSLRTALMRIRTRAGKLKNIPPAMLTHLNAAIDVLSEAAES